jgi:hypothetical protein
VVKAHPVAQKRRHFDNVVWLCLYLDPERLYEIDSPNCFFISSARPFSNGGASGSFFGGGAPAAGFAAGTGGFAAEGFAGELAAGFGSSLLALMLSYL